MATTPTAQDCANIAKRFFDAIEAGDVTTAYDLLAPNAHIWHNTDEVVVTRDTTRKTLLLMHKVISNIEYRDRRLSSWPGGFVHRHVLLGKRKVDGGLVRLQVCVVCDVDGQGRITRLDEYFDGRAELGFGKKKARI